MEDIRQTKDYSFARLGRNNLDDLASLHFAVYQRKLDGNFFVKKYDTGFTGVEYVGYIAYNSDRQPIAYYGVMPCFVQLEGRNILSAQSGDTMTHPINRGQGLFPLLAEMTFELSKSKGIKFIFGFPNESSYPTFVNKLGWIETENLSRFSLPSGGFFKRFFLTEFRRQQILSRLSAGIPGLENSLLEEGFGGVFRDQQFFNYKTFSKTYVLRIPSGYLWVKINETLVIGDIKLTTNDHHRFLQELKQVAKELGTKRVTFQVSPGCSSHDLFCSISEPIPSFPVIFKDLGSDIPFERIKFTSSDIDTF